MRVNTMPVRPAVGMTASIVPAPWRLRGSGYALVIKLPMPRGRAELFASSDLAEARFGQLGCVLFFDFVDSPVGPYRELAFVPGTFRFGKRRRPSVTKDYVSTKAAADSGQHNWGMPKELATFDVVDGSDGVKRVTMQVDGRTVFELWLKHHTLALPITSSLLPSSLCTLGQIDAGHTYEVEPIVHGLMQRAKVTHAWSEPGAFADFSAERVVAATRLSKLDLTLPLAKVT